MFLGDYAKIVDKAISEMWKQISKKKSQNSAKGSNIEQLYGESKTSIWAIEGQEETTWFLIDPKKEKIEGPIDLVSKMIEWMPSDLNFSRPIGAYVTIVKNI